MVLKSAKPQGICWSLLLAPLPHVQQVSPVLRPQKSLIIHLFDKVNGHQSPARPPHHPPTILSKPPPHPLQPPILPHRPHHSPLHHPPLPSTIYPHIPPPPRLKDPNPRMQPPKAVHRLPLLLRSLPAPQPLVGEDDVRRWVAVLEAGD